MLAFTGAWTRPSYLRFTFGALLFLSSVTLCIYKPPFTFTEAQNCLFYLLSLRPRIFPPSSEETKIYKSIILFPYDIRTVPVLLCRSRCQIVYFVPYGFPSLRNCAGTPLARLPLGYRPFWASWTGSGFLRPNTRRCSSSRNRTSILIYWFPGRFSASFRPSLRQGILFYEYGYRIKLIYTVMS